MNEVESYKKLYKELVYVVPHYWKRLGWLHVAKTNDKGKSKHFINGVQTVFTINAWVKTT